MADDRVFRTPVFLKTDDPTATQHEVLQQLFKEVLVPWSIPVSLASGNTIVVMTDGLYAAGGAGPGWPGISDDPGNITVISPNDGKVYTPCCVEISQLPGNIVRLESDGLYTPCCVEVSSKGGNTITLEGDGLYAPGGGGGWPGISKDAGNTTTLSTNDGGVYTPGWPGISTKSGNTISLQSDGIYAPGGGGGWPGISGDAGNIAALSTNDGGVYVPCCVEVSGVAGNILERFGDGSLYVPNLYPGVDPRGDNVLVENPEGLFVPPCEFDIKLSGDTGNILIFGTDGLLYAPCCYPGISVDAGNIIRSGSDGGIYAPPGSVVPGDLISDDADNCLILGTDSKLWVKCPGSSGTWPGVSTDPNNCLGFGVDGGLYIECFSLPDQVSTEPGNKLRLSTADGKLYVPPTDGPSWLPLLFDLDMQTTVRAMIPRDRSFIVVEAFDPPGPALTVSVTSTYYADPTVPVPVDPAPMLDVTTYHNHEVTFSISGRPTGDFTTVSAMVRLE